MRQSALAFVPALSLLICGCNAVTGEDSSRWEISSKKDPLTDKEVSRAVASYDASPFHVDVQITCGGEAPLEYRFVTYDAKDKPAALDQDMGPLGARSAFTARLDDAQAQDFPSYGLRYSNVALIYGQPPGTNAAAFAEGAGALNAFNAAKAHRFVVKLHLLNGDALVEIDQSEEPIRKFLDNCLATVPSPRAARMGETSAPEDVPDQENAVSDQPEPANVSAEEPAGESTGTENATVNAAQNRGDGSFDLFANKE